MTTCWTGSEPGNMLDPGQNGTAPDIEHFQVLPAEPTILKDIYKRKNRKKRKKK